MINKTIPNFRKLVCIFGGGLMPQTRRRRRIRSSGDSIWPAQEQMPGSSSSHVAPPAAQTCVNWDDDIDNFMPPKPWTPTHDVPPLYMNVDPEKRERESQEVRRAILHHLQHHYL